MKTSSHSFHYELLPNHHFFKNLIGALFHKAKASGFNCVSKMLCKIASEDSESNNVVVLSIQEDTLDKVC